MNVPFPYHIMSLAFLGRTFGSALSLLHEYFPHFFSCTWLPTWKIQMQGKHSLENVMQDIFHFSFLFCFLLQGIQTHVPTHALNARNQLTTKSISSHWQPIELFNNALYFSFLSYHKNAIHFVLYPLFVQWTFSWLFYIYELGSGSL